MWCLLVFALGLGVVGGAVLIGFTQDEIKNDTDDFKSVSRYDNETVKSDV